MENLTHQQGLKTMAMGLLHDFAEARTGDLDFIAKNYTIANENKAIHDQFNQLAFKNDLLKLLTEYTDRNSVEARCAKDADQIAQMFHEWVLMWQGNKLAQKWFEGDLTERIPHLHSKSAQKLALSMKTSNPNEWWWQEFVTKDGKVKEPKNLLGNNYKP